MEKHKGSALDAGADNGFAAETTLIAHLKDLITDVGDSSNLILDPELDTFYLMDALIVRAPQLAEDLSRLGSSAAFVTAGATVDEAELERLGVMRYRVNDGHRAVIRSLDVAID